LKDVNTRESDTSPRPPVAALPPRDFHAALTEASNVLIDTRQMLAFGGGHIPGALNFGASGHLAIQAGWMLDPSNRLLLVLDEDSQLEAVTTELARTGFNRFTGYLCGGMTAWENAGLPLESLQQLHVRNLAKLVDSQSQPSINVLDVRAPHEWQQGHVPSAIHVFLPERAGSLQRIPKNKPVAVYCDSGYRASIAASLLQSRGWDVRNVPGSLQAWKACGLAVEKPARA
jgi:hydroxyacylglutathione hydrolase